jgi:acyl-CoA thioesterase-1
MILTTVCVVELLLSGVLFGQTLEQQPSKHLPRFQDNDSSNRPVKVYLDSPPDQNSDLPRVLLLGDSITVGYTHAVRKNLENKAVVDRCAIGGGSTRDGLARLEGCLRDKHWSVIHFNWGLNDLEREKNRLRVPTEQYQANLERLVKQLQKTGAKLIWATTTPVPVGKVNSPRVAGDVPLYNTVAKRVMDENGIPINDLYAFCLPRIAAIQLKEDVHFSETGYQVLGGEVAEEILRFLE